MRATLAASSENYKLPKPVWPGRAEINGAIFKGQPWRGPLASIKLGAITA
jgi:hypothetical protein